MFLVIEIKFQANILGINLISLYDSLATNSKISSERSYPENDFT